MRMTLWAAGVAVAALIPSAALAQQTCQERQHDKRVAGTVVGAVAGGLLGNAVAQHGGKSGGTIIGAVAGAAVGNQLSRGAVAGCDHAYGYYDTQSRWHANAVPAADANGYYDRDGQWVDGAPMGRYSANGEWISDRTDAETSGYRDARGYWVPASAGGYYDTDGQWETATVSGYYDTSGRWNAGAVRGHYDPSGRWMSGEASGRMNADGVWIADDQPGYYDERGHWNAGPVSGYYDARGRWMGASVAIVTPMAYTDRAPDRADDGRMDMWRDAGADTQSREIWLDRRIRTAASDGRMDARQARHALRVLSVIRDDDRHYGRRSDGMIQQRLDALAQTVQSETSDRRAD